MPLLIDGYNLRHAAGAFGRGADAGTLERARTELLRLLARWLPPEQLQQTTIVFDAAGAPPGLPRTTKHRGITVRFAAGHADADALLEELIAADHAPKRLTVVSSDHRVQRAARRRRARAVDSDVWCAEVARQQSQEDKAPGKSAKPSTPLSPGEVQHWMREFAHLLEEDGKKDRSGRRKK